MFPTAIVTFGQEKQLCRLPLQLGPWAFATVSMAHQGGLRFPMDIEFGVLRGRHYAELL